MYTLALLALLALAAGQNGVEGELPCGDQCNFQCTETCYGAVEVDSLPAESCMTQCMHKCCCVENVPPCIFGDCGARGCQAVIAE